MTKAPDPSPEPESDPLPSGDIADLIALMAALRTPGSGCAWDLQQSFATIAPYTIEEAYEVADAIARGDFDDLCDELGDLLLQVVFHARMAQEKSLFDFTDVVRAITTKLIRRHPHVFGQARNLGPDDVKALWNAVKAREKAERQARRLASGGPDNSSGPSLLDGVPVNLPALTRAEKLQARAATVGFDWAEAGQILAKLREETGEIEAAIAGADRAAIADEIGDALFVLANLARRFALDPEAALRGANAKFERRFRFIERRLAAQGRSLQDAGLPEMEAFWQEAKALERGSP